MRALKTDPKLISEYSAKRTADRQEWARQQEEMVQRRINASRMRAQADRIYQEEKRGLDKEMKLKAEEERAQQQVKEVADTLRELANANPDFAARREAMLKVRLPCIILPLSTKRSVEESGEGAPRSRESNVAEDPANNPYVAEPSANSPYVSNNTNIQLKPKGIPLPHCIP